MVILIPFMCQMIIKHYICPVLRPRKGISELESAGDSNDCKTGGSVRLYPRIPFALAMGVCHTNTKSAYLHRPALLSIKMKKLILHKHIVFYSLLQYFCSAIIISSVLFFRIIQDFKNHLLVIFVW